MLLWFARVLSAALAAGSWLMISLVTAAPAAATNFDRAAARGVAMPTTIAPQEWSGFLTRFVAADGRVIDVEKSGMSHSEGQSYGMLLAVQADDQTTFDRILAFTFRNMRPRGDHLVSWSYDPHAADPITDRNNASDGDIIIAYALLAAAQKWHEPRYEVLARPMIADIGRLLLHRHNGLTLLRPGAFGFDAGAHTAGPVVNLSYYVYGALLAFAEVESRYPFFEAWQSGLMLTERAMALAGGYAPDWITMDAARMATPAEGFAMKSSYDAVRIPLFMVLGGRVPARYLEPFDRTWNVRGNRVPVDVDLATGGRVLEMNDHGYRAIAALTACAVRSEAIPPQLQTFRPTTYFSSALHLLALAAARTHYPHCVAPPEQAPAFVVHHRLPPGHSPAGIPLPPASPSYPGTPGIDFTMR